MIDRDDVRGVVLAVSLLCLIAAAVLLLASLDLSAGANIRTRVNEVFRPGDQGLRVWAGGTAVAGVVLATLWRSKWPWKENRK
jgi:hypothetical protein